MLKTTLAALATAGLLVTAALAQQSPPQEPAAKEPRQERGGMVRTACAADIAKLCGSVEAGQGKRFACLVEKKAELSPACLTAVEQRGEGPRKAGERRGGPKEARGEPGEGRKGRGNGRLAACRTDAATFCQNIEKGKGRRVACLKENSEKLAPACREALAQVKTGEKTQR